MDGVMWGLMGMLGLVAVAGFEAGVFGDTASALDQAAASVQRPQLVTPIASPAPQPEARAASRTGSAVQRPGGNGPGAGGPGGQGNGGPGNGGPGDGGLGGPGGPFNHPVPPGAAKKMSEVLGEIVWLMSQSARTSGRCAPGHTQFFIADLEWPAARPLGSPLAGQAAKENELMTPVLLQQFRLFYAQDRPLGVVPEARKKSVLWGQVFDDVEKRLIGGQPKLQPTDWKSGEKIWVMPEACFQHDEVIAPACPGPRHASDEKRSGGGAEEMVKDLKTKVFPDREVHYVTVTKDGKKEVRVV